MPLSPSSQRIRSVVLASVLAAAAAAGAGACDGTIMDPAMGDEPGPTGELIPPFAPAPATISRLTYAQYQASVSDLFGEGIEVPTDLEVDTPLHGFTTIGASSVTIGPRAAEQYEAAATSLATQIFADPARGDAFLGCTPAAASASDPCIRGFVERFGLRAWRRPLETAEVDEVATLAQTTGEALRDPYQGLLYATSSMLQSPHFLFRVERGEPDGTRLRYTGYEIAARLSYFLWGTTPDDDLLQAAQRGDLDTIDGIRAEAERLLDSPRARESLTHFWFEYLTLDRLASTSKDATLFPQWTPQLIASMRGEVERQFQDVVFDRDADFRDLLSSRITFVDAELAALYGLPAPAEPGTWTRVELPADGPRAGLLGTAAFLSLNAHATVTSPTFRGKFIRVNLLCQDIPPPPPGVVTSLDTGGTEGPRTMRMKLEAHRANPICAGCHEQMDPMGLGLENFDPIGAYRTTDQGLPIDSRSDVEGAAFENARELGEILREEPAVGACVARRLYRHALGHVEIETEEQAVRDLSQHFAGAGYSFRELVLALVASDGFRFAGEPE
jgi:hypothetical protein